MNVKKIAAAALILAGIALGSVAGAQQAMASNAEVATGITVLATINPADQTAIDAVVTAKTNYESTLAAYQSLTAGSKESKKAYKVALKAWQRVDKLQQQAKQRIGKTFKQSVSAAKHTYLSTLAVAATVSAKAEAKATRDASIASASIARNDALAQIKFKLAKPTKPTK